MNRLFPRPFPEPDDEPVLPPCRPTAERLQTVLDGERAIDSLDADQHVTVCAICRERVRAARLLLAVLAEPSPPVASPDLTSTIVVAVRADRRARSRRRVFALVGGCAAAAAVLVAVWVWGNQNRPQPNGAPVETVEQKQPPSPAPQPGPAPAPESKPLRINDQLARAGEAFENSTRPITQPAEAAPRVFGALAEGLFNPPMMPPNPDLEPARKSLADIPAAARSGLEPVADTAQKAFSRLMRDVSAIQPGKPDS
jgi:hypothetical protein